MRYRFKYIATKFLILLTAFCISCAHVICDDPQVAVDDGSLITQQWLVKTTGTTEMLKGVDFPNAGKTGYIVGNNGTILKTTDGGETYVKLASGTSSNLYRVDFVDEQIGYVIGDNRTLLKTTDGGATWNYTGLPPITTNHLRAIQFFDKDTGIVAGHKGQIYRTVNGGSTWQAIGVANPNITFYSMLWSDYKHGILGCNLGLVYEYNNGVDLSAPIKEYAYSYNCAIMDIGKLNNGTSFLVVNNSQQPATSFKNIEAITNSWTNFVTRYSESAADSVIFHSIRFFREAQGVVIGGASHRAGQGIVYLSQDTGHTWSKKQLENVPFIYDMDFSGNTVVAVGYNGTIVKTAR